MMEGSENWSNLEEVVVKTGQDVRAESCSPSDEVKATNESENPPVNC